MTGLPGQGFAPGDGVWHHSGEYDADATAFVPLAAMPSGEDPLAAPGHGYAPPPLGGFPDAAGATPATGTAWHQADSPAAVAPGPEPEPQALQAPQPVHAPQPAQPPAAEAATGQWTIPFVAEDAAEESGEYSVGVPAAAPDPAGASTPASAPESAPGEPEPEPPAEDPHSEHPTASYVLHVNGVDRPVTDAWLGESLLYVLRERLGLAGAKDGCEQGECGACSVRVDGRLIASCLAPAATAAGCEILTVEGLGRDGRPSDVQGALAASSAVQCGFCLPGMAMTIHDLLEGNHKPTELEMRQALSGNLCRCSGYRGVLDAVREVVAAREAAAPADGDAAGDRPVAEAARIPHQADGGTA
ncbi:(2Fe-2S)-binding protein [Streptomyces humicola]